MNAYISDSGMSENTESPVMTFSIVICVTVVGLLLSIRFYFRRSGQSLKNTAYESIQSHLLKPGYVSDDNVE